MNFSYMTSSQIAALILGVIFSVFAVASTFLAFKYAHRLNSFLKAISMSLVAPFLAMVSWLFLILSFLDGFRNDEVLNLIISLLISLFICCMIVFVAKALYNKNKDRFEQEETEDLNTIDVDQLEENEGETYLLKDSEKDNIEETLETETVDNTEVEPEKSEDEKVEENLEYTEEENNTEEETVEKEEDKDITEETKKEVEIKQDVDEDKPTDDDEDFQKFLDELRKKIDDDNSDDSNK